MDWDWSGAEREFKKAIELAPNDSIAPSLYAEMLSLEGRHAEAIAQASRARELDPTFGAVCLQYSRAFLYARQYDKSVQAFTQSLEVNPHFWPLHLFLGETYEQQGLYASAMAELRKGQGPTQQAISAIGHLYAISGRKPDAEKILAQLLQREKTSYLPPTYMARIYAGLGEKDEAFAWLEKAYDAHDTQLEFLGVEQFYDPLRADPRYADLMRRINLAH